MKIRFLITSMLCLSMLQYGCSKPDDGGDNNNGDTKVRKSNLPPVNILKNTLNDTGITWGGDYPKNINDTCVAKINTPDLLEGDIATGDILPQQDCMHGLDTAEANGKSAFRYRKINHDGQVLADDADGWFCVLDEVSGLVWETKQASDGVYGNRGMNDSDDKFTWYNANTQTNGGAVGDWNNRYDQCAGFTEGQPRTYCNLSEFVSRINKHGLCGLKDWRVPTRTELSSLVNYGRTVPAVDANYFPHTQNDFYWTNSAAPGNTDIAWAISMQFGYSSTMRRTDSRYVRLVRKWEIETK